MSIEHFLGFLEYFTVEAENKSDAIYKGIEYVKKSEHFSIGNHYANTVRCVKKINSKKKKNVSAT